MAKPSPVAAKQSKRAAQHTAKETEGPALLKSPASSSSSAPTGRGQKGRESTAAKQGSVGRQLHTSEPAKPVKPVSSEGKAAKEHVSGGTTEKPSSLAGKGELVDVVLSDTAGEEKAAGGKESGTLQDQRTGEEEKSKSRLALDTVPRPEQLPPCGEQDGGGANSNAPPTMTGQSGGGVASGAPLVTSSQLGQTALPVQHSVLPRTTSTPAADELDGGEGGEEVAKRDERRGKGEEKREAGEGWGGGLEGLPSDFLDSGGGKTEAMSKELPSVLADAQDMPPKLSSHVPPSHSATLPLGSVQTRPHPSTVEPEPDLKPTTVEGGRKHEERGRVLEEVPLPDLPPAKEQERNGLSGYDSASRADDSPFPTLPSPTLTPPLVKQTPSPPSPPPTLPFPPTLSHSASSPGSTHLPTAPEPEIKSSAGHLAQTSDGVLENAVAWKEEGKEKAEVGRHSSRARPRTPARTALPC